MNPDPLRVALRYWCTGEPIKTAVLRRFTERLAPSKDEDAMERIFRGCITEAEEMIGRGDYLKPKDWNRAIDKFLEACRFLDAQGTLSYDSGVYGFQEMMQQVIGVLATVEFKEEASHTVDPDNAQADVLLIGDVERLIPLADDLQDNGKQTIIIDTLSIDLQSGGKAALLAAIREVRQAIIVFGTDRIPQDPGILEALAATKQLGRPVVFVPMSSIPAKSILDICK